MVVRAKAWRLPGETFEDMLSRFNFKVHRDGVIKESKQHWAYEKPGDKARKKSAAARKRNQRGRR